MMTSDLNKLGIVRRTMGQSISMTRRGSCSGPDSLPVTCSATAIQRFSYICVGEPFYQGQPFFKLFSGE